jgi:hypothetical protein
VLFGWEELTADTIELKVPASIAFASTMGHASAEWPCGDEDPPPDWFNAQYGLEFVRYALRRLWLGERSPAYLRGYSVAHTFEEHVSAFSTATKK